MQLQPRLPLKIAEHAEKVLSLRIPARSEHADEALRRRGGRLAELLEADRRLDVVAQDRLAGIDIAVSMVSMPSRSSAAASSIVRRALSRAHTSMPGLISAGTLFAMLLPFSASYHPPSVLIVHPRVVNRPSKPN